MISKRERKGQYFPHWIFYKWVVLIWKSPFLLYYLPLLFTLILCCFSVAVSWLYWGQRMHVDGVTSWSNLKMPLTCENQLWGCLHEIVVKWFVYIRKLPFCSRWGSVGQHKNLENPVTLTNPILDLCDLRKFVFWLIILFLQRFNPLSYRFWAQDTGLLAAGNCGSCPPAAWLSSGVHQVPAYIRNSSYVLLGPRLSHTLKHEDLRGTR